MMIKTVNNINTKYNKLIHIHSYLFIQLMCISRIRADFKNNFKFIYIFDVLSEHVYK